MPCSSSLLISGNGGPRSNRSHLQAQGDKFSLREFHDFVWKNGNVPIALLRYEYLGKTDEIEALGN